MWPSRTYSIGQMGGEAFPTFTTDDTNALNTHLRTLANERHLVVGHQVLMYGHCPEMGPMTAEDQGFVVGSDLDLFKPGTHPTGKKCVGKCKGQIVRYSQVGQADDLFCGICGQKYHYFPARSAKDHKPKLLRRAI